MRLRSALALLSALLVGLPVLPAEGAPALPTLVGTYTAAPPLFSGFVIDPATAADAPDGGVTMNGRTITPPVGKAFSDLTSFSVATTRDATHGTVSGLRTCPSPVGSVDVREAAGTALALDYRVTCGTAIDSGVLRRASAAPYGFATLSITGPDTVPYSGGSMTAALQNLGTVDLVPGPVTATGVVGGSVSVSADGCNGVTVAPGGSCPVTVAITPDPSTPREAFSLQADVPGTPAGIVGGRKAFYGGARPGPVQGLTVDGSALMSVGLHWQPPADDGGNPLTYQIVTDGFVTSFPGRVTSSAVMRLSPGVMHSFQVRAVSVVGPGPLSDPVTAATGREALVVERPDGQVWAADPATPTAFFPTYLLRGGAAVRDGWVGNSASGVLARQDPASPSFDATSPIPAAHDLAGTESSDVIYARRGPGGVDAVYSSSLRADLGEDLIATGVTQPTQAVYGSAYDIYGVPAGRSGPSGGNLVRIGFDPHPVGQGRHPEQVPGTKGALHPSASPDGRWLAYTRPDGAGHQRVHLRSLAGPLLDRAVATSYVSVTALHWRPDARALYVNDAGGQLLQSVAVDPQTGPLAATTLATGAESGPAQWVAYYALDLDEASSGSTADQRGVSWYAEAGATYDCALDGVTVRAGCRSPFFPALRNGAHALAVTKHRSGLVDRTTGRVLVKRPTERDFTGDGRADIAVFRPSNATWYVRGRPSVTFGRRGDQPLLADFDGDGTSDIAVFRPSNRTFYVRGKAPVTFGTVGDVPVVADWNGDGLADIALFRPSTGFWYIRGQRSFQYGTRGDLPYPGYWRPDSNKAVPAVCRRSDGTFHVRDQPTEGCPTKGEGAVFPAQFTHGQTFYVERRGRLFQGDIDPQDFGLPTDIPVLGLYNGTFEDLAVFRPSTAEWLIKGHTTIRFGRPGDVPL